MESVKLDIFGKLNLSLNITGVLPNGFHAIDTVMQSVSICDKMTLKKRNDNFCRVQFGGSVRIEHNSALKAAERFVQTFESKGAELTVSKGIPFSGGMGGSSADAAGALIGMAALYGVSPEKLEPLADELGSDVKYMLKGGLARAKGTGGDLEFYEPVKPVNFVLLRPGFGLSTAAIYASFDISPDCRQTDNEALLAFLRSGKIKEAAGKMFNALQKPALEHSHEAKKFFAKASKITTVFMTGSGSCFFVPCSCKDECVRLCLEFKKAGINAKECVSVEKGIKIY